MRRLDLTFLAAIAASRLLAHDLYVLPARFFVDPGKQLLVSFNNGDSFPVSEASPVLKRVRDTNLISAKGPAAMRGLRIDGNKATATSTAPPTGEFIVTIRTIPNFLKQERAPFLAYLKEEGLLHVMEWRTQHEETKMPGRERYSKYAKALLVAGESDGFFAHQVGFPIEIIPESDPYKAKPGNELPVRVVFKGNPAADLQLEAAWTSHGESKTTIAGRTDSEGRITIHLDRPGLWRLHALKMERCSEPTVADWESYWASLTFEVR